MATIEELIRELKGDDDSPAALIREHLESARFYLLGAMPSEYQLSLKLVDRLLPNIEDKEVRARVSSFLHSQHPSSV